MNEKAQRIGVMGGTFNPVHFGHLVTAEAARVRFSLDKVIFVPSGNPPHKPTQANDNTEHRLMMTLLATISNPYFDISRIEIDRGGYSYTFDTINTFKQIYGEESEIYFITGADAILEICSWKNAELLIERCVFIAATRPGFNLKEVESLPPAFVSNIELLEVPALSISSTDIRQRVAAGEPIRYLLPEIVENYIVKHRLYQF